MKAPGPRWVGKRERPLLRSVGAAGGLVAYSLFPWARPQGLKRDLVVLGPSLCLPAPFPTLLSQSQASDVVVVSSKYKQRYECRLPAGAIHFQREREEETPAYQGPGIPELLSPMRDAPCLLKVRGTGVGGGKSWEREWRPVGVKGPLVY